MSLVGMAAVVWLRSRGLSGLGVTEGAGQGHWENGRQRKVMNGSRRCRQSRPACSRRTTIKTRILDTEKGSGRKVARTARERERMHGAQGMGHRALRGLTRARRSGRCRNAKRLENVGAGAATNHGRERERERSGGSTESRAAVSEYVYCVLCQAPKDTPERAAT
jgi:hypothetical protein